MKTLTTCLLIQNDKTAKTAIESVLPLGSVLVGNIGTNPALEIRKMGASVITLPFNGDYAAVKNKLLSNVKTPWVLFIEPWEKVVAGTESLEEAMVGVSVPYRVQIIQGQVLSKETRLWPIAIGLQFHNPIYETTGDQGPLLDLYLASKGEVRPDQFEILKKWKLQKGMSAEPYYYHAAALLNHGRYVEFLKESENYLFKEKKGISAVMMQYYRAIVFLYVLKNSSLSLQNLLPCMSVKPSMAEFWCLLGDIFYHNKNYLKAKIFYENAIHVGSRRLRTDQWPIEISKYKDHPDKMIKSCQDMESGSFFLGIANNSS
jgi:hypothetical protein